MSFYGHEIHVGVDCFSVEPLGLRPGGSLFLPPCELVNQNPQLGLGSSLGNDKSLVVAFHQLNLGVICEFFILSRFMVDFFLVSGYREAPGGTLGSANVSAAVRNLGRKRP